MAGLGKLAECFCAEIRLCLANKLLPDGDRCILRCRDAVNQVNVRVVRAAVIHRPQPLDIQTESSDDRDRPEVNC